MATITNPVIALLAVLASANALFVHHHHTAAMTAGVSGSLVEFPTFAQEWIVACQSRNMLWQPKSYAMVDGQLAQMSFK